MFHVTVVHQDGSCNTLSYSAKLWAELAFERATQNESVVFVRLFDEYFDMLNQYVFNT